MADVRYAGIILERFAATALGGHRAVALVDGQADYASADNLATALACFGITIGAVASGAKARVQIAGRIVEGSWNWTPNEPIYLGLNGLLTQTPPTGGNIVRQLGLAETATSMLVQIQPAIRTV